MTSDVGNVKPNGADQHPTHTDAELVRRWLHSQRPITKRPGGMPLWARVEYDFAVGSTSAKEICRRHGYDPDKLVARS